MDHYPASGRVADGPAGGTAGSGGLGLSLTTTFDGYTVVAKLGQGGMAEVYLAVAGGAVHEFRKVVVLKVLHASLCEDSRFVEMFHKEARIAARLNHANVVHTYAVAQESGQYAIVMEYLEGASLSAVLKRAKHLPVRERLSLLGAVCQTLQGLHYLHEFRDYDGRHLSLIHRDVKPGNIFLTFDGQAKVLDFGVAKMVAAGEVTATMVKGTAQYMAPEALDVSRPVDRRLDVFAVGLLIWELAHGRSAWGDLTAFQILGRLTAGVLPPCTTDPHLPVPPRLVEICRRAIAIEPSDRHATALELKQDLDAFIAAEGIAAGPEVLAGLVETSFASVRHQLRHAIRDRLQGLDDERGRGGIPTPARAQVTGRIPTIQPDDVAQTQIAPSSTGHRMTPPASRFPTMGLLLALALLSVGTVIGLTWRQDPRAAPEDETRTHVEATLSSVVFPEPAATATRSEDRADEGLERLAGSGDVHPSTALAATDIAPIPAVSSLNPTTAPGGPTEPDASGQRADSVRPGLATGSDPALTVPSPAAEPVTIDVKVWPSTAELFLDGSPLQGNPTQLVRPRDGSSHTLSATAVGHKAWESQVAWDQSRLIEVSLLTLPPERSPRGTRGRERASGASSTIEPKPTPGPTEVDSSPGVLRPGDEIQVRRKPERKPTFSIDRTNPWAASPH